MYEIILLNGVHNRNSYYPIGHLPPDRNGRVRWLYDITQPSSRCLPERPQPITWPELKIQGLEQRRQTSQTQSRFQHLEQNHAEVCLQRPAKYIVTAPSKYEELNASGLYPKTWSTYTRSFHHCIAYRCKMSLGGYGVRRDRLEHVGVA